jgi:Spy/CpxP family protein refolding chaperone
MKRYDPIVKFTVISLLVGLGNLPALADPPAETTPPAPDRTRVLPGAGRPGSDPLQLLQLPKVQQELQLTEEQIQKLKAIDTGTRERLRQRTRGADLERQVQQTRQQVADVLKPQQLARFRGILLQVNGWEPESPPPRSRGQNVRNPIELSPQQRQQLTTLQEQTNQRIRGNVTRTRSSDPAAICQTVNANRQRIEPIRQASQQQALEALTPEQRATLDKLKGEPFELEPPPCNS